MGIYRQMILYAAHVSGIIWVLWTREIMENPVAANRRRQNSCLGEDSQLGVIDSLTPPCVRPRVQLVKCYDKQSNGRLLSRGMGATELG
jgi:hypothetical protein